MENTNKVTQTDILNRIIEKCGDDAEIVEYCEKTIAAIAHKKDKAKERAAERRVEGDELRAAIEATLTAEYQTVADIFAQLEGDELTEGKIRSRLSELVRQGKAVKEQDKRIIDGKTKKVMTYAIAQ